MNLSAESLTLRVQAEQIAALYQPNSNNPNAVIGNPDTVQRLLAALRDGNYRETACHVAGLSKVTLYNWFKRAEAGDEAAQALVNAIEKAESEAEADTVHNVRQASKLPQFWAAGMTYLERKHPERWGRRQDESSTPRVVVQIGTQATDITVNVIPGNTSEPANSLPVLDIDPINQVNRIPHYQTLSQGDAGQDAATTNPGEGVAALDPAGDPPGVARAQLAVGRGVSQRAKRGGGKKKG
jgi:hypothetical protein